MKKLILIKRVDDVTIGHLYEHLYCMDLAESLRSEGLFSYVDYSLDARNYHSGTVYIELELYSEEAVKFAERVTELAVDFDESSIDAALLQIMAEKEVDIAYIDHDKVLRTLRSYHAKPWTKNPRDDFLDQEIPHSTRAALVFEPRDKRGFGIIEQTITLDITKINQTNPSTLLPLFVLLSKAIRSNLQEDIANTSFCFTYDDHFEIDGSIARDINLYRVDKRQAEEITTENEVTSELIAKMNRNGLVQRMSRSLREAEPEDDDYPVMDEITSKLGVTPDPQVWKETATEANLTLLLDSVKISFVYK